VIPEISQKEHLQEENTQTFIEQINQEYVANNSTGPKDSIDKVPSQTNKVAQAVRQVAPSQTENTDTHTIS
jgi:hypothetical protein